MKLVSQDTRLDPPYVCFICEGSPQREIGEQVVDTEYVYNPPAPSGLRGRKYICGRCVEGAYNAYYPEEARQGLHTKKQPAQDMDTKGNLVDK